MSRSCECESILSPLNRRRYLTSSPLKRSYYSCGDIFHPLIRDHAATCLADESYTDEIQSFIPYLSTTTVYFQLACRIPYLVQLQLMAKCLPKLDETMTKVVIRRMLNFVCNDRESRRFEDYKPLAQAVQEARSLKKRGDQSVPPPPPSPFLTVSSYHPHRLRCG